MNEVNDIKKHTQDKAQSGPRFIVGVGSSAGGLEALRTMFGVVADDIPMAFVVVQHLAPKHKSRLVEILAQSTSLRVKEIRDGDKPEIKTIYVTPPNADVFLQNGVLRLVEPHLKIGPKPSVDYFFRSLADNFGEQAIGIVLSGTGSDGAHGVRAIKAAGGFTISQAPNTAKYDGMPKSAKHTGEVDLELSPEKIAEELSRFGQLSTTRIRERLSPNEEDHFDQIFQLLEQNKGTNFSNYKPSTVKRRVERRVIATRCNSIEEYADFLRENPSESNNLFQDILISVTAFFRDPKAFKALGEHIEQKIKSKPEGEVLRCWIIGCATGEEPYSIAILVAEAFERLSRPLALQVFATDLDEVALNVARRGCYSRGTFESFPKGLQEKYFIPSEDQLQIRPWLRDLIIFARHNVIEDPPFLNTDLVSCRNVLIYFNSSLQERVFNTICYSLNNQGVLFLGRSEAVSSKAGHLFAIKDKESRIYYSQKEKGSVRVPTFKKNAQSEGEGGVQTQGVHLTASNNEFFSSMINSYAPNSLIIDQERNIKHLFGRANEFLRFPKGEATYDISKLLPERMGVELTTLLFRVAKTNKMVEGRKHELHSSGDEKLVSLQTLPLRNDDGALNYLIVFNSHERPSDGQIESAQSGDTPSAEEQIVELRRELLSTKEQLQLVTEEHQASDEELQSLNEELQSANEELQSSNEELETTNEELQSSNEELTTLNQELNVKSGELQLLYNRHKAIQQAIAYPILVIDSKLNILDFNPPARHLLRLGDADMGTQVQSMPSHLDLTFVKSEIVDAITARQDKRFQFQAKDRSFEVQIQLFYGERNSLDGAVICFIDNSEITMALDEARIMKNRLSSIIDNTPAIVTMKDLSGVYIFANNRFFDVTQTNEEQVLGSTDDELFGAEMGKQIRERDFDVLKEEVPKQFEETYWIEGEVRFWTSSKFILLDTKKRPYSVCTISLDITDRVYRERELELFRRAVASAKNGTIILGPNGGGLKVSFCSEHFASLLGVQPADLNEISLPELLRTMRMQEDDSQIENIAKELQDNEINSLTFTSVSDTGEKLTFELRTARLHSPDDEWYLILSLFDLTGKLKDQRLILAQQEELSRYARYSALGEIAAGISHEINTPLNVITANTDILKTAVKLEKLTSERVLESADDIDKMARGISDIVHGLKTVAGIEPGSFESIPMQKVIRDALKICEIRLQRANVELRINMPQEDISVQCYPIQIMQIIINLVNNAVEAVNELDQSWIEINLLDENESVVLKVMDSGSGIDPGLAEKIMTPFFSTKKEKNGTGIGLSLSRSIAKRHQGDLYLDTTKTNTCFCLKIAKTAGV